jgi:hypothetical protein
MQSSLELAVNNLTSVAVLLFALGFFASRINSDVRIPESVYQFISVFLLFGIGLKGGHALKDVTVSEFLAPSIATIVLAFGHLPLDLETTMTHRLARRYAPNASSVCKTGYIGSFRWADCGNRRRVKPGFQRHLGYFPSFCASKAVHRVLQKLLAALVAQLRVQGKCIESGRQGISVSYAGH